MGFTPVHKRDAGFRLMEYEGDPEEKLEQYEAPSGRRYKFNNDACQEYVHPMDVQYLKALYPIKKVPWRGVP